MDQGSGLSIRQLLVFLHCALHCCFHNDWRMTSTITLVMKSGLTLAATPKPSLVRANETNGLVLWDATKAFLTLSYILVHCVTFIFSRPTQFPTTPQCPGLACLCHPLPIGIFLSAMREMCNPLLDGLRKGYSLVPWEKCATLRWIVWGKGEMVVFQPLLFSCKCLSYSAISNSGVNWTSRETSLARYSWL